jgi:hypothetical protein
MEFAAQSWVQAHRYSGNYELSALEIIGSPDSVITFVPNIL